VQVTKDIVRDLLPVYLAGDARADTRAAVGEFLELDRELREMVASVNAEPPWPAVEAPPSLEQRSLEHTRSLLGRKNFWLSFALIFTMTPVILRPFWLADLAMLIGVGGWAMFLDTCRRLRATGLEPARRWRPRLLWGATGTLVGYAIGYLIRQETGYHRAVYDVPLATGPLASWIGEKLRQIPSHGEMARPATLFGPR
jgi:hypothetical protein